MDYGFKSGELWRTKQEHRFIRDRKVLRILQSFQEKEMVYKKNLFYRVVSNCDVKKPEILNPDNF